MSTTRTKVRSKVKWSHNDVIKAFRLVEDGKSIRKAARSTGVPFSTLQERLKHKNSDSPRLGRHTVFTAKQEEDMASQIKFLAKIFYGCTARQIRKMAYEYAVKNKIKHHFNETLQLAGKDWIKGFMRRNKLAIRKACLSMRGYEFCRSNNIIMLSLPPHGSHRIQPMDVSFYGPFKAAYKNECNLFMKTQLGRKITQNDIASLFRKAFQKIATVPKAEAGFASTGIYPLNPDVFTDEDFLAADILNKEVVPAESEGNRDHDNKIPDDEIILFTEPTDPESQRSVTQPPDSPSLIDEIQPAPTNTTSLGVLQPNVEFIQLVILCRYFFTSIRSEKKNKEKAINYYNGGTTLDVEYYYLHHLTNIWTQRSSNKIKYLPNDVFNITPIGMPL